MKNVTKAWKEANQEQRNKLARQLFNEIWVKDKQVLAVKPRPELKPFFQLSYEEWLKKFESENPIPLGGLTSQNSVTATITIQFKDIKIANINVIHPYGTYMPIIPIEY